MNNLTKTAALGLFVIVGAILFLGGALWLRGKSLGADDVHILYADIGNLKEGAPVRISGAPVGRVTDIVYQGQGKVTVGVKFSEKITVRQGATAAITSVGMLGDEVIMLEPGKGEALAIGDTIQGSIAAGVFDKAAVIADQAAQTLTKVNAMLDPKLVADLRNTLNSTQQFMAFLADQKNGPTSQVNATMVAAQRTAGRLDSTLAQFDVTMAQVNLKGLQARLDTTMTAAARATNRLTAVMGHADSLMTQIQHGDGAVSKLLNDPGLYADLRKTMQAMTDLLNEIAKNPGKIGVTVRIP
jgi:phospholipid/cholesterol/gamma-HCH transport system substrate-binding protein